MMIRPLKIGIIGDFDTGNVSHTATVDALTQAAKSLKVDLETEWLPTDRMAKNDIESNLKGCDGFWGAPGSPYKSMQGALRAIQFCRENGWPFLGTWGGFQYALVEYARNALGIQEAEHAETRPDSPILIINKLSCSLVGQSQTIQITPDTLTYQVYGSQTPAEQFQCNYGLNEEYRNQLFKSDLKIAGIDADQNVRIVELDHHPFFIATLFLPQLTSTPQRPHPLIKAYLKTIAACPM